MATFEVSPDVRSALTPDLLELVIHRAPDTYSACVDCRRAIRFADPVDVSVVAWLRAEGPAVAYRHRSCGPSALVSRDVYLEWMRRIESELEWTAVLNQRHDPVAMLILEEKVDLQMFSDTLESRRSAWHERLLKLGFQRVSGRFAEVSPRALEGWQIQVDVRKWQLQNPDGQVLISADEHDASWMATAGEGGLLVVTGLRLGTGKSAPLDIVEAWSAGIETENLVGAVLRPLKVHPV